MNGIALIPVLILAGVAVLGVADGFWADHPAGDMLVVDDLTAAHVGSTVTVRSPNHGLVTGVLHGAELTVHGRYRLRIGDQLIPTWPHTVITIGGAR